MKVAVAFLAIGMVGCVGMAAIQGHYRSVRAAMPWLVATSALGTLAWSLA